MNNQMQLNYNGQTLSAISRDGEPWFTAAVAGAGLGYKPDLARENVRRLYRRHQDEFSDADTGEVKLSSPGGIQQTRIFSLSGIVLLGFFSGTEKAKSFRQWAKLELEQRMASKLGLRPTPQPEAEAVSTIPTAEYIDLLKCRIQLLEQGKKPTRRTWSEADKAKVFALHRAGYSNRQIANQLGRPKGSIGSLLCTRHKPKTA